MVEGRRYNVRVEEEVTFRTVTATNQVVNHEANSEPEDEDDEVVKISDDMDGSKNMHDNSEDGMDKQDNRISNDRAKNNGEEAEVSENKEEEAEKVGNNGLNDSHHSGGEKLPAFQEAVYEIDKEPIHKKPPLQEKTIGDMAHGNSETSERNYDESINSVHGLDSIVPDSQSPLEEECFESVYNSNQSQNIRAHEGNKSEQEKESVDDGTKNPVECESNTNLRASQVQGINLHVDLNPSAVRRNIRSQRFEASLSTDGDDIDGYIIASQEQEQMDKELQNTILAGNNLGIKFGNSGIMRMKKMIEDESKAMKESLINNSFAPLMRDH